MKKTLILFIFFTFICNNYCLAAKIIKEKYDRIIEIYEDSNFSEVYSISNTEPVINSKNAIVIDRKTLSVLYEKNCYDKTAMASTTKIMTCILALENCSLTENVKISKPVWSQP